MYLLGYDIGSSSVKAALVDARTNSIVYVSKFPESEMEIISKSEGWAEQEPESWWDNLCIATKDLLSKTNISPDKIKGIGIAYQMHGLVLVDKNKKVLRPSIIWCDSRAVDIGRNAFIDLGEDYCLSHYLNSPGNFTASKLKWVKEYEPDLYDKIHRVMLPGDYIAMKLTGNINSTVTGLSEGVLWDFKENDLAHNLMDYYGFDENLFPPLVENFKLQGRLSQSASDLLGLERDTPVTYRAGDQANNAMSLSVFKPGEVAATGGTSGVVYGVVDKYIYDPESRINGFAHVNHTVENPRVGLLLCINGAGSQYSWIKNQVARDGDNYEDIERMISSVPVGSDGLKILPFGNGAERMLNNEMSGAQINNLQFNRHSRVHLYRASLEGIAFSFVYGFNLLKNLGLNPSVIKVGNDNLFQSNTFSKTIANLLGVSIEIFQTTGAAGAAFASGIGINIYSGLEDAFSGISNIDVVEPENDKDNYNIAYQLWKNDLDKMINTNAS